MPPKADGEASNANSDEPYTITNIKCLVPTILDLEELNYKQWKSLFVMNYIMHEVEGHLDGKSVPNGDDNKAWIRDDTVVKMWIYNIISKPILQMVMQEDETAQEVWTKIASLFQSNKDARQMQLNEDLRNIELGDLTITKYCHKLKVIADLLENIGKPIEDSTLVMYTVNSLSAKYENIAGIIRHQKPLSSFVEVRAMLELEESRLNQTRHQPSIKDSSSSPTVLLARGNNTNNNNRNNNTQVCRNYQRGMCTYGARCRFIHGNSNRNNNMRPQGNSREYSGLVAYYPTANPTQIYYGYYGPSPTVQPASMFGQQHSSNFRPPPGFGAPQYPQAVESFGPQAPYYGTSVHGQPQQHIL